jgi:hypothetical protein
MMASSPPERFAGPPFALLSMLSLFIRRPCLVAGGLAAAALLSLGAALHAQDRALLKACLAGPEPAACHLRLHGR